MFESVGIDIERNQRFKDLVKNDIFLKKHFSEQEIKRIKASETFETVCGIFVLKEAAIKALYPLGEKPSFFEIQVTKSEEGFPIVNYTKSKDFSFLQSLSHTKDNSVGIVIARRLKK